MSDIQCKNCNSFYDEGDIAPNGNCWTCEDDPDWHKATYLDKVLADNRKLKARIDELEAINKAVNEQDVELLLKKIETTLNDIKAEGIVEFFEEYDLRSCLEWRETIEHLAKLRGEDE